ncbi:hypothetical protein TNCV_3070431 [Trichonephila clavipes]|nr:hypothetical protein TNCV_3070431 [Trichonephila clavipes]
MLSQCLFSEGNLCSKDQVNSSVFTIEKVTLLHFVSFACRHGMEVSGEWRRSSLLEIEIGLVCSLKLVKDADVIEMLVTYYPSLGNER